MLLIPHSCLSVSTFLCMPIFYNFFGHSSVFVDVCSIHAIETPASCTLKQINTKTQMNADRVI